MGIATVGNVGVLNTLTFPATLLQNCSLKLSVRLRKEHISM